MTRNSPSANAGLIDRHGELLLKVLVPVIVVVALISLWHIAVIVSGVPQYILPSPAAVAVSLVKDWGTLAPALWVTTQITMASLALALIGGVGIAVFLVQSRWIETCLLSDHRHPAGYPDRCDCPADPDLRALDPGGALLICAFLVAFFPILSNMVQGLKSVDHNLLNLFDLYGASRWQTLLYLKLPASLPYFMTGLRIGGGLALIAAVVAEFAAGSAGAGSGLAFRLLEAQYRLNIPRLFAALFLLSCLGVLIFAITSFISWLALHRWHESSLKREN